MAQAGGTVHLRILTTVFLWAVDPTCLPLQLENHQHLREGDHTSALSEAARLMVVVLIPQMTPTFTCKSGPAWMTGYVAAVRVPSATGLVGPWVPGQTEAS